MDKEGGVKMGLKDKRLIDRMKPEEKEKYLESLLKNLPDCKDEFEYCEIEHEDINLLEKIKQKKQESVEGG